METIKTACMVIVLMAIGYGVYTVLNQPEEIPPEVAGAADTMDLSLPDFSQMAIPGGPNGGASSLPPASIGTPSSPMPPTSTMAPVEQGMATGRLTAPQLDATVSDMAPPFASSMPKIPQAEEDTTMAAARQFAGAGDLPPMRGAMPENPARSTPPTGGASAEAPIPTSEDSSRTQLASVYTGANGLANVNPSSAMPSGGASAMPSGQFPAAWDEAQVYLRQSDLVEATRMLTPWRNSPELTPSEKEKLNLLLSQLAGTVVYSTQHTLEEPYAVGSGETVESIAQQFQIPTILLQRINGIDSSGSLSPGQKLKVLQGPFLGTVDLTNNELTLEIDGCYAGRFPVTVENGAVIPPGEHEVLRKEENPQYFDDTNDQIIASNDPANPYGGYAIHLDGGIVLHSTGGPGGSISLSPRDAEDIFGILSVGSKVAVRR